MAIRSAAGGTHGGNPLAMPGRREALPHVSAGVLPGTSVKSTRARYSRRCRTPYGGRLRRTAQPHGPGRFPKLPNTACPGKNPPIRIAGRIANLFASMPNFVVDAACVSAMAAITAAADGLGAERVRRGDHGRGGPQYGCPHVREVQQDRCALGDGVPMRMRRWFCDGRGRCRSGSASRMRSAMATGCTLCCAGSADRATAGARGL